MKLVLIGPQGSGKGTQAKLLREKFKIPHISTGDMFRENIEKKTELGIKAKAVSDSGKLMPDNITNAIVEDRLKKPDAKKGFILDGYPRNIMQAEALEKFAEIDHVLDVEVSDSLAVKRLSSRWQCRKCGAIYGITLMPKKKWFCDKDGSELYQRDDDRPEVIRKRLEIYHKETKPLIDFYRKKGILAEIDGNQPVEKIFGDIMWVLE